MKSVNLEDIISELAVLSDLVIRDDNWNDLQETQENLTAIKRVVELLEQYHMN